MGTQARSRRAALYDTGPDGGSGSKPDACGTYDTGPDGGSGGKPDTQDTFDTYRTRHAQRPGGKINAALVFARRTRHIRAKRAPKRNWGPALLPAPGRRTSIRLAPLASRPRLLVSAACSTSGDKRHPLRVCGSLCRAPLLPCGCPCRAAPFAPSTTPFGALKALVASPISVPPQPVLAQPAKAPIHRSATDPENPWFPCGTNIFPRPKHLMLR